MITAGYALGDLAHPPFAEQVSQFGLADQDDLQEFLRRRLEVRQQPDLLQYGRGEVLCLVDDDDGAPAA